jgi:hypothetical protein
MGGIRGNRSTSTTLPAEPAKVAEPKTQSARSPNQPAAPVMGGTGFPTSDLFVDIGQKPINSPFTAQVTAGVKGALQTSDLAARFPHLAAQLNADPGARSVIERESAKLTQELETLLANGGPEAVNAWANEMIEENKAATISIDLHNPYLNASWGLPHRADAPHDLAVAAEKLYADPNFVDRFKNRKIEAAYDFLEARLGKIQSGTLSVEEKRVLSTEVFPIVYIDKLDFQRKLAEHEAASASGEPTLPEIDEAVLQKGSFGKLCRASEGNYRTFIETWNSFAERRRQ